YWTDPAFSERVKLPTPTIPTWDIAHFINTSECIEIKVENTEQLKDIQPEWIEGISQFLSSVDDSMSFDEQAEKFTELWAKYQGVSKEQAYDLLLSAVAETNNE
ncbi:hypothetical protein QG053_11930, partial [Kingella kingae]|uniref:hypothetical protein n=1 Tax=Kingella kingae TaxID=504 RepID=UPI002550C000